MAKFAISLFILCVSSISLTEAQRTGFSAELIRRDSPKSPFYNPEETNYQRQRNAFRRSVTRLSHFDRTVFSPNTPQADIIPDRGEFLMNISIGTPPFQILAIADTGSDLTWTQCKPCPQCFKQDAPLFDPKKSSTYRDFSCNSTQCSLLAGVSCSIDNKCHYHVAYGDLSTSNGNLAGDTVTLGSTTTRPVVLPKTIFGCGHDDAGTFAQTTSGIIGLGGGSVSLISQLGSSIAGKFSYCLVPVDSPDQSSTKINFGTNGVVSGSGVVSTPLVTKIPRTFYFITLEAISVGSKRIPFDDAGTSEGNVFIDSGTTFTFMPPDFNSKLISAVSSLIKENPVPDPERTLDLCYNFSPNFKAPKITVHFTGADVELTTFNTFVRISDELICFVFKGSQGSFSVYGNLVQTNFLVGYDTEKKTLSFKPTDCTKQ
ncbi:aspartic proteinase CDR1-like [Melia azedarach]|uniref:Aspartic proteinase CDR1-like n=1 Tax=Melia azedarach TaxID=155640 RepID=A0ACC1YCC0_MELAZ|nr:aspartic proteinase CDR1-like [Melia azedarach]